MNIIWFVIVVGALAVIQMEYFNLAGLRKVEYRRFFSKKAVYEGDKAEMVEVLANKKITPLPWLRVESRISSNLRFKTTGDHDINYDQFHRSSFFLRGYKRITRRHEILCARRGFYVLKVASVTTGDLFGMLRKAKDVYGGADAEMYVYPAPIGAGEESLASLKWQGDVTMRRWIMPDPILVSGIRDYRPGDTQKDIHWAATARTGNLQVKVRDYTVSPRLLLMLNTQIREDLWGMMDASQQIVIEQGIRYAAHLATWAVSNGLEVGLQCNGPLCDVPDETVALRAACSQAHLEAILQSLAKLEIVRTINFYTLMDYLIDSGEGGYDIALISAYTSPAIEKRAELLRLHGNNVTFIDYAPETASGNFAEGVSEDVEEKEAV